MATREEIYLAALLHDIGKFVFRASSLKIGEGHEKLGEEFIRENFGKINILKDNIETIVNESKHHETQTITAVADRIASTERESDESKDARRPLLSIFNAISLKNNSKKKQDWYFKPSKIDTKNIFPISPDETKVEEKEIIKLHYELLTEFKNEINKLKEVKSIKALNTIVYFLLNKYTSRVLSAGYKSTPDISLFDHSRAVACIANCLTSSKDFDKSFLFIKGDLKGIQNFIYYNTEMDQAGATRGLSKRLRGRSFLVSLLTDFIANLFIEELQLAEANLIYSGGGHFNIIAPFNKDNIEKIELLLKKINLALYDKFGNRINLIIGTTICDESLYVNTGKFNSRVNFEIQKNKNKIHEKYLEEIIFKTEYEKSFEKDETKIGEILPYTKYIVELTTKEIIDISKQDDIVYIEFNKFKKYYIFFDDDKTYDKIYKLLEELKDKIEKAKLIKINDTDFLEYCEKLSDCFHFPISFSFKYFGQYAHKDKENNVIEFEKLAKLNFKEEKELSYPLLAVMRLDVDNLGSIFELGLGENDTFSRIANLSRELDIFFSGYINNLAEEFKIYIVYSGGDDAFIIGSWYNVIHFAKELYKSFRKFVCYNNDITFSAGIFLCNENYPVAKFANKAAELEELSKEFKDDNKEKNAVTVFDHTLSWDSYCTMIDFAEKLLSYTNEDGVKDKEKLNRSLTHRLLRIIKSSTNRNGSINLEKLYKNISQLHYLFARHGFTEEKILQAEEGLEKEIISVILKEFSKEKLIKNYIIPTNYVILKTRKI